MSIWYTGCTAFSSGLTQSKTLFISLIQPSKSPLTESNRTKGQTVLQFTFKAAKIFSLCVKSEMFENCNLC